ncbi:hypothetical protein H1230_06885 [Paenibacillus sp. 19GGS1-52]|uniref:hypothetical protein n=1 Tax=Paenibacillus sp. 19GGS1-52 TaxID=2758563 RepID=UPI001EFBE3ED|nr:hypothetical protein [Paenibacillus sp. 19GGS1-52]ULO08526.1 hypothetical protein H1230_06885 [Paenibacillus sp. 19GGS1-52]
MGATYQLMNLSKKEVINYSHLPASKLTEIVGNPVASAITTWYLINNIGDTITFLSELDESPQDIEHYKEVTDRIINDLIQNQILKDEGLMYVDEDDSSIYIRNLKNIWID